MAPVSRTPTGPTHSCSVLRAEAGGPGRRQVLIAVRDMAAPLVSHILWSVTLCSALLCSLCRLCPERMGDPSWRESGLPVKGHQQGAVRGQIQCHLVSAFSACGIFPPRSVPLELLSRFHGNHSPLERSRACVHSLFLASPHPSTESGPLNAIVTTGTGRQLSSLSCCATPGPTADPLPKTAGPVPAFQKWVVT